MTLDGGIDQGWVTFTRTNRLLVAVPVTVAVTVVMPDEGVFAWVVKLTVVPAPSVAPLARKLARSFDHL